MNEASPTSLVRYDAMCRAIDAAYEVDEVKIIRDQAIAWEVYSRQAKNVEAERRACEIRLRAEKKAGQLSKKIETAPGTRTDLPLGSMQRGSTKREALQTAGVTTDQAHRWEKLADVPEDQFEAALAGPDMPTTAGIIAAATDVPVKRDERALWLLGRLRDFERDGLLKLDPNQLLGMMSKPHEDYDFVACAAGCGMAWETWQK